LIEISHIRKAFGAKTILEDISAQLEAGKCNRIIGTCGSGKTVLTNCIVGLFTPDSGDVLYSGESMLTMNKHEKKLLRQQIGVLFQGSTLFDSKTVEENVRFPLDMFSKQTMG
jgi:phospholipid/cholesterol/gamma-HCH transport system ATP-binding protein